MLFTLRNRKNAATGLTPSEALLGEEMPRPGEWTHPEIAREIRNRREDREKRVRQAQKRQIVFNREMYPQHRQAPIHFSVGNNVLVRNFSDPANPISTPWKGPFPVTAIRGDNTYEVDRNGSQMLIHVDDLRPAPGPRPTLTTPQKEPGDGPDEEGPDQVPLRAPAAAPGSSIRSASDGETSEEENEMPAPLVVQAQFHATAEGPERSVGPVRLTDKGREEPSRHPPSVRVSDIEYDPEDEEEARPTRGETPIVGLYP